jgi:hypothetical protein
MPAFLSNLKSEISNRNPTKTKLEPQQAVPTPGAPKSRNPFLTHAPFDEARTRLNPAPEARQKLASAGLREKKQSCLSTF